MISDSREGDYYLFVLWETARGAAESAILQDVAKRFKVLKQFEVLWSDKEWERHLQSFYGVVSPVWSVKRARNGTGAFRVVLVEDVKPIWGMRPNMRGIQERVDVNVWEAKRQYRKLSKIKDAVHSSVSMRETRQNFAMLIGRPLGEYLQSANLDGSVEAITRLPPAEAGWRSIDEFFMLMNECTSYVVLRNEQNIHDDVLRAGHGDIDLLVQNVNEFTAFSGAVKIKSNSWHTGYLINIAGKPVRIDIRFPGDGYYDEKWESVILRDRVLHDGVYVPCERDKLSSLFYHALIHKASIAGDYLCRFGDLDARREELVELMRRERYCLTRPVDDKVGFYPEHLAGAGIPIKKVRRSRKSYLSLELTRKHLKLHLFPACGIPNLFRVQLRLGGAFKIDFCVGVVRDFVIVG